MDKAKKILETAQLVLKVAEDLRNLADSVQAVCNVVVEGLSTAQPKAIERKPEKKAEPEISLEEVRGVLAKKSQAGFTAEVKAIIQKHGADRLSAIDPKEYKAVMAEAEALGNG